MGSVYGNGNCKTRISFGICRYNFQRRRVLYRSRRIHGSNEYLLADELLLIKKSCVLVLVAVFMSNKAMILLCFSSKSGGKCSTYTIDSCFCTPTLELLDNSIHAINYILFDCFSYRHTTLLLHALLGGR
jgi:hypothetical protein